MPYTDGISSQSDGIGHSLPILYSSSSTLATVLLSCDHYWIILLACNCTLNGGGATGARSPYPPHGARAKGYDQFRGYSSSFRSAILSPMSPNLMVDLAP